MTSLCCKTAVVALLGCLAWGLSGCVLGGPHSAAAAAPAAIEPIDLTPPGPTAPPLLNATAVEPAQAQYYVVQKGDTLWKIAQQHYGDGKKWKLIADANPLLDPTAMRPGMRLVLP